VAALQSDYNHSDWQAIRRLIVDRAEANGLVTAMQQWNAAGVGRLRASLVYSHGFGRGLDVGTVRLAGDARVVPDYRIYVFRPARRDIVAAATGVRGSSYKNADWMVTRLGNFIVYHSPYQVVGADRRYLGQLESQRGIFMRKFHVRLPPLAAVYLYPTVSLMRSLTHSGCGGQDEIGCTDPFAKPPTIQTTIQAIFHEAIHVYQLSLVPPGFTQHGQPMVYVAPRFIAEGMAVALQNPEVDPHFSDYCSSLDWVPLNDCARDAILRVNPMKILSDKRFFAVNPGDAYSLGGSFVTYLIESRGYRTFGRFYYVLAHQPTDKVRDYEVATHTVYHTSIETLLARWRGWLCRSGC